MPNLCFRFMTIEPLKTEQFPLQTTDVLKASDYEYIHILSLVKTDHIGLMLGMLEKHFVHNDSSTVN